MKNEKEKCNFAYCAGNYNNCNGNTSSNSNHNIIQYKYNKLSAKSKRCDKSSIRKRGVICSTSRVENSRDKSNKNI